jgi:Holliday junction resolvasome RuvABC endonuclease subunit
MSRLAVDPGLAGTGTAIWGEKPWKDSRALLPWSIGNLYSKSKGGFEIRSKSLVDQLIDLMQQFEVTHVYCEMPEFFQSAAGVMVASAGDLQKLTFVVGCYASAAWNHGARFIPITPTEWKGQVPKDAVIRKIEHILPRIHTIDPQSHSWDAIGIGLYAQGKYHR